LIIAFEVTSEAVYEQRYRHPCWPQGNSGVTFAIGYDAGYVTAADFESNWKALLDSGAIAKMKAVCGLTGTKAQQALPGGRDVDVSFESARTVFRDITLPRTSAKTAAALPRSSDLSPDCFGALVSLVYNRGASFSLDDDRYREIRAIKLDIADNNFSDVPVQLRNMKRLWADKPNMAGLVHRRELDALLFEQGLNS
jgi:GH24 family phage-related lysozyme (muramidase)